jgi:hypothetical protein
MQSLTTIVVREQDVIGVLNTLDPNKAVGPDIISNKMLIAVKNEVAKPLCLLFNKSFQCFDIYYLSNFSTNTIILPLHHIFPALK